MAGIKCACIYRGKCSCIWIWITITIRIPIPIRIRIRIRQRQRQSSSSSRSRIIIMHNGPSQRRGKFFPLISAAFVDSRVLSSKLQAPSSQLPGSKGRRQASLVVGWFVGWLLDVWTTGPKGGLFCLLHNKKIIPPFCARAAFLLLMVRFYLFFFCQQTGAVHYFPFAIFNALSLRLRRHSCQRDLSSRPANRIGGRCWATSLSRLPFLRHILMGIICIMKIKNFMLVTHSPSVPR